jgi:GWxTD domain-containing protein
MIRKIISLSSILCLAIFSISLISAAQQKRASSGAQQKKAPSPKKIKESDLGPKYQNWLNLTAYIILPQEKDVFMQLSSDFERDIFIDSFWKQRDPTPGTPENEYKQEIEKRFLYVNKEFHKDTPRPGWMTDRGRIYMILGEPKSINRFSQPELQPCELWSYYGDVTLGQPNYFGLIFFRRHGSGEYVLYSPFNDGPSSLIQLTATTKLQGTDEALDTTDREMVHEYIMERAPDIAPYTLSITPNDIGFELEPSAFSEIQMAEILESPRKRVNASYATHFMNYKGLVSTDYLTNFVDSEAVLAVAVDPVDGIPMLHYSVAPKHISIDYYQPADKYYCNYSVDVSLKKGETFIYQSSKDFSYYFAPSDSGMVSSNGIAVQDSLPAIPGTYHFTALLRNSVGKEFSLLERDVTIEAGTAPRIAGLMLGYKVERVDVATLAAFKLLDQKAYVDAKNTFSTSDTIALLYNIENLTLDLWKTGEIRVAIKGAKSTTPSTKNFTVPLNRQPYHSILPLTQSVSAADLTPDYYDVTLSLVNQEKVVATKAATFIVSPAANIARPVILAKTLPRTNVHLQYLALAGEAEKAGEVRNAQAYYDKALSLVPDNPEATAYYCGFLMRTKQFEKALSLIDKVKADPSLQFDYYIIKGKALRELGRCEEAIPLLEEGNKLYNSDTRLLNALGYCYYKTGQPTLALEVLNASLRLSPNQPDIKKLVEEIGKK